MVFLDSITIAPLSYAGHGDCIANHAAATHDAKLSTDLANERHVQSGKRCSQSIPLFAASGRRSIAALGCWLRHATGRPRCSMPPGSAATLPANGQLHRALPYPGGGTARVAPRARRLFPPWRGCGSGTARAVSRHGPSGWLTAPLLRRSIKTMT